MRYFLFDYPASLGKKSDNRNKMTLLTFFIFVCQENVSEAMEASGSSACAGQSK